MFSSSSGFDGDHMYPSYLIIKRHEPCYSMPFCLLFSSCLLFSLLLNPNYASKIGTHVFMWICLQAYLKDLVKSINDLLDSYWSSSCNKLCFHTLFNNFDSCFICYSPQLCYFFGSFILSFFYFSFFDFLCNCLVHRFFP
jgi:hypothetical protein